MATIQELKGGVSTVTIDGEIVKKTYTFEHDDVIEGTYGYLTTELVILNLLEGTQGFPVVKEIVLIHPNIRSSCLIWDNHSTKRIAPTPCF